MKQTIRIIGGQYRGKKLHFPNIPGLRPTPDRIRETLFNWLMHDIRQAHCLDAFAGSGALGFEAFSRGAADVVLVEQAALAAANLRHVATEFATSKINVIQGDACEYLRTTTHTFDLIFFDPPFAMPHLLDKAIHILSTTEVLKSSGLLYLETPEELILATHIWEQVKLKQAGQVTYALYRKISDGEDKF